MNGNAWIFVVAWAVCGMALADDAVKVWVSSTDMKDTLSQKESLVFGKDRRPKIPGIEVDPAQRFQTILGIGSSLEHATCFNLSKLDSGKRDEAIDRLVNPQSGIGMNLMRVCIGTSDFVGEPWYSYDDMPAGETDPQLDHFSIEKDRAYVLPVLKTALAKNPNLVFFASPWSPPGWMKDSGQMCGGKLLPEHADAYARYLVRFVQAYEAEGIPIYAMTLQNEPGVNEKTYPSCAWNGSEQRDFIKQHLGPAFKKNGLKTKIWCFDHNFNNVAFPRAILSDPEASSYVDGTAFHLYEGKPEAMGAFAAEFPDKPVYFTEGSTYKVSGAIKIMNYFTNMARSYNAWVTVIDDKGKPNNGPHGCSPTCIVLNSGTLELKYNFDYSMYGHFAKFIQRDAVRLGSTPGTPRFGNVAFRNPDGTIVLIVANAESEAKEFKIRWNKQSALTSLGPQSMATYQWHE